MSDNNLPIFSNVEEEDEVGGGDSSQALRLSRSKSIASDGESHDLKLPLVKKVPFAVCGPIFRIFLWILLAVFQCHTLTWFVFIGLFVSESTCFTKVLMSPSFGLCSIVEILFNLSLTVTAVIQLLQRNGYNFLHKSRIIFNVIIATYLSHLCVFVVFPFVSSFQIKNRIKTDMRHEIEAINQGKEKQNALHKALIRGQEKFKCCGFGSEDYGYENMDQFPKTCCPMELHECNATNAYQKSCLEADSELSFYYLLLTKVFLVFAVAFGIILYYAFRYFRPYWTVEARHSATSIDYLVSTENLRNENGDEDEYFPSNPPPTPSTSYKSMTKKQPHEKDQTEE